MSKIKKKKFKIDFFEFSFLVEACIPPRPIARSMFWDKVIDEYYHELTKMEVANLYDWIGRNDSYKRGLENKNEQCLLFEARFNPDNQYEVICFMQNRYSNIKCFKFNDRYYTKINIFVNEAYIQTINKIK